MGTTINDMTGYVGQTQLPVNPYASSNDPNKRALTYGDEFRQFKADTSMAQYNQQMAEAQLLKQRQWALEDRDYNSPAQLRKRLEEAGYNPSLMQGAIQTANSPVRASTTNTPSTSASNMAQYGSNQNAAVGNLIDAGRSLASTIMQSKQMEGVDAQINLNNSQSIEALSRSAKTNTERIQMSDLFEYQKDALMEDINLKRMDSKLKNYDLSNTLPAQLANIKQSTKLSEAQVQNMADQMQLNKKLTTAEINSINQKIKEGAQAILQSKETVEQIKQNVRNGEMQEALNAIELKVRGVTKYADMAAPYVNIVTEGISNAIGLGKLGQANKAMQLNQFNQERNFDQKERKMSGAYKK